MVVTIDGSRAPYIKRQTTISRNSGNLIESIIYERDDFKIVSGVLYSNIDPLNALCLPESTFSLFLNPQANYPVPCNVCVTMETWTEELTFNS